MSTFDVDAAIEDYAAGVLSPEDASVLARHLSTDPDRCAQALKTIADYRLIDHLQQSVDDQRLIATARRIAATPTTARLDLARQQARPRWRPRLVGGLLAATILVAIGLVAMWPREQPMILVEGPARIERAGVTAWHPIGDRLRIGDVVTTGPSTTAAWRLGDGSRVDLARNSGFTMTGLTGSGQLLRGGLQATVHPRPADQALILATPLARFTVVGTRFSLTHDDGKSLLQVMDGVVAVERTRDGAQAQAIAGSRVAVNAHGPIHAFRQSSAPLVPLRILAKDFATPGFGNLVGHDIFNVWGPGSIRQDLDFPAAGTYRLAIESAGRNAAGAWPQLQIDLDRQRIADLTIDHIDLRIKTVRFTTTAGVHRLAFFYPNDQHGVTGDRDLNLRWVEIAAESGSGAPAP